MLPKEDVTKYAFSNVRESLMNRVLMTKFKTLMMRQIKETDNLGKAAKETIFTLAKMIQLIHQTL